MCNATQVGSFFSMCFHEKHVDLWHTFCNISKINKDCWKLHIDNNWNVGIISTKAHGSVHRNLYFIQRDTFIDLLERRYFDDFFNNYTRVSTPPLWI